MIDSSDRRRRAAGLMHEQRPGEWARAHLPALDAYALALCGNPDDASDLVQDTFERALSTRRDRLPQHNRRAWLCTVLRHLFLDRCRKETRRMRQVDIDLAALPDRAEPEAAEPAWCALDAGDVRAALSTIDELFAAAFCLHALEGRSYADVARAQGVSVNTVGTRILRARRKLRAALRLRLAAPVG